MRMRNITTGIELNSPNEAQKISKPNNKKIYLLTLLIVLVIVSVLQIKDSIAFNETFDKINTENTLDNEEFLTDTNELGDEFYKLASDNAPIPAENSKQAQEETHSTKIKTFGTQAATAATSPKSTAKPNTEEKAKEAFVTVDLMNTVGRVNPFVPTVDLDIYSGKIPATYNSAGYPEPPKEIIKDEVAENLMATTISGILYDAFSPSAIISIEGQDHLVRKGDRINGYKILNITKDRVVVQNGTNIYRATVGEVLTTQNSNVNFNNVYDLPNRFGGARTTKGTKLIEIN